MEKLFCKDEYYYFYWNWSVAILGNFRIKCKKFKLLIEICILLKVAQNKVIYSGGK